MIVLSFINGGIKLNSYQFTLASRLWAVRQFFFNLIPFNSLYLFNTINYHCFYKIIINHMIIQTTPYKQKVNDFIFNEDSYSTTTNQLCYHAPPAILFSILFMLSLPSFILYSFIYWLSFMFS